MKKFCLLLVVIVCISMFNMVTVSAATPGAPIEPLALNGFDYYYTTADLNIREYPSTESRILTYIPNLTRIYVEQFEYSGWSLVRYGSSTGYVSSSYLLMQGDLYKITGDYVNLRSSSSTSSTSYGLMPYGTRLKVTGSETYNGYRWIPIRPLEGTLRNVDGYCPDIYFERVHSSY